MHPFTCSVTPRMEFVAWPGDILSWIKMFDIWHSCNIVCGCCTCSNRMQCNATRYNAAIRKCIQEAPECPFSIGYFHSKTGECNDEWKMTMNQMFVEIFVSGSERSLVLVWLILLSMQTGSNVRWQLSRLFSCKKLGIKAFGTVSVTPWSLMAEWFALLPWAANRNVV